MDQFHKICIREKQPNAHKQEGGRLCDVLEEREGQMKEVMGNVLIAPGLESWARRMRKRFGAIQEYCGADVIMGHLPVNYLTALMMQRYGHDPAQWPKSFEPSDFERAMGWENGHVPSYASFGEKMYLPLPIAGGAELTDFMEAQIGNHLFRTELTTVTVWPVSTAVSVGDIRRPTTYNDTLFECVVAGTTGGTEPTWNTGIGVETTDNTATWIAIKQGLPKRAHFMALFTAAPGETGGGTEVTGGSYARDQFDPVDANWNASVPAGAAGRNDNLLAITFPAPTANWGVVSDMAIMDRSTGGNYIMYSPLTTSKTVNNADPAPNFAIGALDIDFA